MGVAIELLRSGEFSLDEIEKLTVPIVLEALAELPIGQQIDGFSLITVNGRRYFSHPVGLTPGEWQTLMADMPELGLHDYVPPMMDRLVVIGQDEEGALVGGFIAINEQDEDTPSGWRETLVDATISITLQNLVASLANHYLDEGAIQKGSDV